MADAIVINKADGDNIQKAKFAKVEFNRALHLFPAKPSGWTPKVVTCSAITKDGIDQIWKTIEEFLSLTKANGQFEKKRSEQNQYWMLETINEQLKNRFYNNDGMAKSLDEMKNAVQNHELSPFAAAQMLLEKYFNA